MMIKNTTPIAIAMDELAGFAATHQQLTARRETLVAEVAVAKSARREMLIARAAAPEVGKAERKCVDLENTLEGVDDALAEVARRQAGAQAALDLAEQDEKRVLHADQLMRSAATIEATLVKVVDAARSIADGIQKIQAALSHDVVAKFGLSLVGHERADATDIALFVIGSALGAKLPEPLSVTTSQRLGPGDILGRPSFGTIEVPDLAAALRGEAASLRGESDKPAAQALAA